MRSLRSNYNSSIHTFFAEFTPKLKHSFPAVSIKKSSKPLAAICPICAAVSLSKYPISSCLRAHFLSSGSLSYLSNKPMNFNFQFSKIPKQVGFKVQLLVLHSEIPLSYGFFEASGQQSKSTWLLQTHPCYPIEVEIAIGAE